MLLTIITALSALLAVGLPLKMGWSRWMALPMFAGSWLALLLLALAGLCLLCAMVDLDKPQEEDSPVYRFFMYQYIDLLLAIARVHIEADGVEKLPQEGRFLLVCNHQDDSDPALLLKVFRKNQLAFISKKENRTMFAVGKFMHKTLCQMIDRENDREALKTILKCIQLIKEDKVSIAVFPEGGIKVKGKLSPFRSGVFKIAQKANVPIVVCTLKGSTYLIRNALRGKGAHVQLHLLEVIPAEELKGVKTTEIAQRVHDIMQEDLGEEFRLEA